MSRNETLKASNSPTPELIEFLTKAVVDHMPPEAVVTIVTNDKVTTLIGGQPTTN